MVFLPSRTSKIGVSKQPVFQDNVHYGTLPHLVKHFKMYSVPIYIFKIKIFTNNSFQPDKNRGFFFLHCLQKIQF